MRSIITASIFLIWFGCSDTLPGSVPSADSTCSGEDDASMAHDSVEDSSTPGASQQQCGGAEARETCWDGLDNDCDGLTDQEGGDSDCDSYCHPADGVCADTDPATEDFCSPLTWKCENRGCSSNCDDQNPCTKDWCENGQCITQSVSGCTR